MGLLDKLFGRRGEKKEKEEEEVRRALEDFVEAKEKGRVKHLVGSENFEDSDSEGEEQKPGEGKEELEKIEAEQEQPKEETTEEVNFSVDEDKLIAGLKKEGEEAAEEIHTALKKEMDEIGDVSASELLRLGRTTLQEMKDRE